MRTTLLALHGFTLNGAIMRQSLGALAERFEQHVELVCLDAPHTCSAGAVDRLYARLDVPRLPPPHLCWWDASDDGLVYNGWEETLALIRARMERKREEREGSGCSGSARGRCWRPSSRPSRHAESCRRSPLP